MVKTKIGRDKQMTQKITRRHFLKISATAIAVVSMPVSVTGLGIIMDAKELDADKWPEKRIWTFNRLREGDYLVSALVDDDPYVTGADRDWKRVAKEFHIGGPMDQVDVSLEFIRNTEQPIYVSNIQLEWLGEIMIPGLGPRRSGKNTGMVVARYKGRRYGRK
jgi:hypothetical protein